MMRRLSEMWISGSRRKRRLADDSVLSLQLALVKLAPLPQRATCWPTETRVDW